MFSFSLKAKMNCKTLINNNLIQNELEKEVLLPDEFPFPYEKPYDIQLNFMKSIYKTLELGKIGIFESPTGTVHLKI